MANLSDVEDVLVDYISLALYPNGTDQQSIIETVNNIYIYAGWPNPDKLERDIKANNNHVSIFPQSKGRNMTKFRETWHEKSINDATLFLTVSGNTVTITGTVTLPQTCVVIVNKLAYPYIVVEGDTLNSIAQSLTNLIPNASAIDNVITINNAYQIIGRVVVAGTSVKEIKRQEIAFNIITWSNTRNNRTLVSEVIENSLGEISRILLPADNYWASINFVGPQDHDEFQKTFAIYRRDLIFTIEFPTTIEREFFTIAQPVTNTELVRSIT